MSASAPSELTLLPRARLRDVAFGRAQLVGARCSESPPRGMCSPIEARFGLRPFPKRGGIVTSETKLTFVLEPQ